MERNNHFRVWEQVKVARYFKRITIVGPGLIGGSIGIDALRLKLAEEVIGVGRRPSSLRTALKAGALSRATLDLADGVAQADLLIFATPVRTILPLACRIVTLLKPGAVITDVASTKSELVLGMAALLKKTGRKDISFVGSHPLAGSHRRGAAAAHSGLFQGAVCILAGAVNPRHDAVARLTAFWKALGMKVVVMSPQRHDALLAQASHLPHLLAAALMRTTEKEALKVAAGGFRDTTRIAASDPALWTDIILTNRGPVLRRIRNLQKCLLTIERAVSSRKGTTLKRILARSAAQRGNLEQKK